MVGVVDMKVEGARLSRLRSLACVTTTNTNTTTTTTNNNNNNNNNNKNSNTYAAARSLARCETFEGSPSG